jgi:hypothetical protein
MKTLKNNKCMLAGITLCFLFLCCSCKEKKEVFIVVESQTIDETDYTAGKSMFPSDYSDDEGYVPTDGFVPTPEIAVQIATSVLNGIYGKENIDDEKPFFAHLENGVWIIEGSMESDPNIKGGVAYIEMRKSNAEILKVVHGK